MVYSSRQPPQLLPGEENLKDAIQAAPLHPSEGLPETARLDYSAAFLVPYDRPVRHIAVITEDSLSTLRLDYAKFVNYEGLRGNDKTWGLRFTASSESLFAGSEWSAMPSESTEATSVFEHSRSGSISSQRFDFSSTFQKPQTISEPPPQRTELGDFEVEEPMEEEIPSKDLQQTIGSGQTKALEFLIENSPETWKKSNFAWIEEMLEMGYDAQEVAELLVEKARDSPWIYSEKHEDPTSNLKVDWHNDSCPHASLTEAADEPAPSDETESLPPASSIASSTEISDVASTVEKLCGLGGIFPWSRYANDCSGQASFDLDRQEVSLSLHPSWKNLHEVMHNLCCAASLLQEAHLCCDSFTVLVRKGSPRVKMVRILFSYLMDLCETIEAVTNPEKKKGWNVTDPELQRHYSEFCWLFFDPAPRFRRKIEPGAQLHVFCLIVQTLAVGLLSYSQAHITPLRPSFLDTDIQSIRLLGHEKLGSSSDILAEPVRLSCISDMLQGRVLVFRFAEMEAANPRPLLTAFPEDILSTWGPGCYLTVPGRETQGELYAMRIKGGTITASNGHESMLHWYPTIWLQIPDQKFRKDEETVIGADTGALTTIKENCPKTEREMFDQCNGIFSHLGTQPSHLQLIEHQIMAQLALPNAGTVQYGQVYRPIPATTIKEAELNQINPSYTFLNSFWGLQVSFCTGVAKRVRMRELIADMLSVYVARGRPRPSWFQHEKTEIIDAFRDEENKINLEQWLAQRPQNHQDYLWDAMREIIDLLKVTGIDKSGALSIAWVIPDRQAQCLRVECERESYWAKVLTDSSYCATFAYFTSACLETEQIKCTGPTASWPLKTPVLSTAVSLHQKEKRPVPVTQLEFQKDDLYFIGKSKLRLQVKVEKMPKNDGVRLLLLRNKPLTIPSQISRRMSSKGPKRLREKTDGNAPAHPVLILTGNHLFGFTRFSSVHTHSSDVSLTNTPAVMSRN
ncbi:uncharacterized protein IWZ02DRAFT_124582 [Phyllosticta citriasiana]|uniref:uncharacterized protein n=1 Tax=Phyllosticta citriasiana TaxID=595635 RepID=UPI0030FD8FD1